MTTHATFRAPGSRIAAGRAADRPNAASAPWPRAWRRLAFALLIGAPGVLAADTERGLGVGLETGALVISRNDARVPGDTGTRLDLAELTDGAIGFVRIGASWTFDRTHSLHLVYAPLRIGETAMLPPDTTFEGETFDAGEADGTYQFTAWKLTWRYTFADRGAWRFGAGFTGVVRDAEIALRQGDTVASNDNVGFVPTLHLYARRPLGDRWAFRAEFDGLAGGPGRLFDIALKVDYALNERLELGIGYRTLEGGADVDEVYNFAWLNYAAAELRYRF